MGVLYTGQFMSCDARATVVHFTGLAVHEGVIVRRGCARALAVALPHFTHCAVAGPSVPGFHDAHIHALSAGRRQLLNCDVRHCTVWAQAQAKLTAFAHAHAPDPRQWVVAGGWQRAWFPGGTPPTDVVDKALVDRKVCPLLA